MPLLPPPKVTKIERTLIYICLQILYELIGGQILTKAELLALRSLFSEHVISKLTKEGFSIPDMIEKDVATTLQQVQYILKNVGESTTCDQLKEELYSSMVTHFACIIILWSIASQVLYRYLFLIYVHN